MDVDKANVPDMAQPSTAEAKPKFQKKQGNGSRQRKTDAFRLSVEGKQLAERTAQVRQRLFLNEDTAELERSLRELSITTQPVAIPLPVATRGVGFSTVVEYSRMCTTWNLQAIVEICTIYQYYRVSLFLVYYKLYLARYDQGESPSFDVAPIFVMNDEYRQVIGVVTQVPISTHNILCSVGKVDGSTVFHSYVVDDVNDGEQAALYLYPSNICDILDVLENPNGNQAYRKAFYDLNPLPGAEWEFTPGEDIGDPIPRLANAGTIWPAGYDVEQLQHDVHCYSNLLIRVGGRLPNSFLSNFTWNGKASKSMLVCSDPVPMRLIGHFNHNPQPRKTRRRDACGRAIDVEVPA